MICAIKNFFQRHSQLRYFRQNIGQQILQAIAVLNGMANIVGSIGYIVVEDYAFACIQTFFGLVFIIIAVASYKFRKHDVLIQWVFFISVLLFVLQNSSNDIEAFAKTYFIPLSIISAITAHNLRTAIMQAVIVLGAMLASFYLDYMKNLAPTYDIVPYYVDIMPSPTDIFSDMLSAPLQNAIGSASILVNVMLLLSVLFIILTELYRRSQQQIQSLLLKALPQIVVEEIQSEGEYKPKQVDNVAILFLDFVNFTKRSSSLGPEELLRILNLYFLRIEKVCRANNVEKIKTLGDGFLAIAGAPYALDKPADNALKTAQDILMSIQQINQEHQLDWEVRIGLHIGTVITGIVGDDKYLYDVWGDNVNIAARMEQNSQAGRIAISQEFYDACTSVQVEDLGKIKLKGKGPMQLYLVQNNL